MQHSVVADTEEEKAALGQERSEAAADTMKGIRARLPWTEENKTTNRGEENTGEAPTQHRENNNASTTTKVRTPQNKKRSGATKMLTYADNSLGNSRMLFFILGAWFGLLMIFVMKVLWLDRNTGNANFLFFMKLTYVTFGSLALGEWIRSFMSAMKARHFGRTWGIPDR